VKGGDKQINTCYQKWRQDRQMMVLVVAQVGDFMSVVTKGE
jgi:hypothetical protein